MTRIDGINHLQTSRLGQSDGPQAAENDGERSAVAARLAGRQDEVRLSNRGRIVADAVRHVHGADEVREAKVAALKAAIANGSYSSNSRDIAARLLTSGTFGAD
jgi:negative regulator of flagellin synthesis FlgM